MTHPTVKTLKQTILTKSYLDNERLHQPTFASMFEDAVGLNRVILVIIAESNSRSVLRAEPAESGEELDFVTNKLDGSSTISASVSASETSSEDSNSTRDGVIPLLTEPVILPNNCS